MPGDPLRRARIAYFRAAVHHGMTAPPAITTATLAAHQGRRYVMLMNGQRTLAVYRIGNNGLLHRLKRWPGALHEAYGYG